MTRYLIGDLRSGKRLLDLNVLKGPWTAEVNGAGSIGATVTLNDPDMRRLALRNAATPGKSFLAVVENDNIMNAGPIWTHDYDRDAGTLQLTAAGLWSYWDHRVLIPVLAAGVSPQGADTVLTNLALGTQAKRLVEQARLHTGGNVPVVFQDDEIATDSKTFKGSDLKLIGDALNDFTAADGGPDIDFTPRFTADRLGIEWVMRTGTKAKPRLSSPSTFVWDLSVPEPSVRGLKTRRRADSLTGRAWVTGGRTDDKALYSRYENPLLASAGYPLLEVVDSANATVPDQATLDALARETARIGSKPMEFWTFDVDATISPLVGDYRPGDNCVVKIGDDPYIPKNISPGYQRRIMEMSGDEQGDWISLTTGEVYSLDG